MPRIGATAHVWHFVTRANANPRASPGRIDAQTRRHRRKKKISPRSTKTRRGPQPSRRQPTGARRVEDAADAPVDAERVARQRRNKSAEQNVNKSPDGAEGSPVKPAARRSSLRAHLSNSHFFASRGVLEKRSTRTITRLGNRPASMDGSSGRPSLSYAIVKIVNHWRSHRLDGGGEPGARGTKTWDHLMGGFNVAPCFWDLATFDSDKSVPSGKSSAQSGLRPANDD